MLWLTKCKDVVLYSQVPLMNYAIKWITDLIWRNYFNLRKTLFQMILLSVDITNNLGFHKYTVMQIKYHTQVWINKFA